MFEERYSSSVKSGEGGGGALRAGAARCARAPAALALLVLVLGACGRRGEFASTDGRSPFSPSRDSLSGSSSGESPSSSPLPFASLSFDEALARARAENKLVFLDVYTDWCGWCTKMDRDVLADARVKAALADFVPIRVNADKGGGRNVASRYRVRGLPTFLVVNADGDVVRRFEGYVSIDTFLRNLGEPRRL